MMLIYLFATEDQGGAESFRLPFYFCGRGDCDSYAEDVFRLFAGG